jgi:hypothetical protein
MIITHLALALLPIAIFLDMLLVSKSKVLDKRARFAMFSLNGTVALLLLAVAWISYSFPLLLLLLPAVLLCLAASLMFTNWRLGVDETKLVEDVMCSEEGGGL